MIITYSYIRHSTTSSVTMKGFFDKNIKSRSKDDRLRDVFEFFAIRCVLIIKSIDNFLPHCLVGCGSACLGGEQEVAFIWICQAVKSYNVIRRRKFIRSRVFSARISAAHLEHENMGAQRFDQKAF